MNNSKDVITVARALQAYLSWAQGEEIREEVNLAQAAIESLERLAEGKTVETKSVESEFLKL